MYNVTYYLSDDYADSSPLWQKTKYYLCGDHLFGNVLAPLWLSTSCTCCAFFRGFLIGSLIAGFVSWLI